MATVAVFGMGDIGGAVCRRLAAEPDVTRLWGFDVDRRELDVVAADAAAMAAYRDRGPEIRVRAVDMQREDQVVGALSMAQPDVVVHAATLQSWWVLTQLPSELWRTLEHGARFGPWLPLHLTLVLKLMRARAQTGLGFPVVNVAFPDAVNPVLGCLGLAPTCGAGNSDLLWAGIRAAVARRAEVPIGSVQLSLLAHHFHVLYYWMGLEAVESLADYPFWLRVLVNGHDVTAELGASALLAEAGRLLPKGRAIGLRTAESVVKNVLRLVRDDPTPTHTPGPAGLVGGYDVRLRRSGLEVLWPPGLSPEEARAINERAQRGDGIERIGPDGSVTFTSEAHRTMKEVLGYDCALLTPDDAEARAEELKARLAALVQKG